MRMKNEQKNEVYILGSEAGKNRKRSTKRKLIILACILLAILAVILFFFPKNGEGFFFSNEISNVKGFFFPNREETTLEYYFEPELTEQQSVSVSTADSIGNTGKTPYIDVSEETAGHAPLWVYTPHHATMSLMVGLPDSSDMTIIFAAMAADIRKDNLQIVGDFVLAGKQLARGIAKKGYAAIMDDKITIGVGTSTPLLQQAIESKGYFFRQYPLVFNGELIENNPKNRSIRRALAVRDERIIMVESKNRESFHDFSQALIDIGISDAIYLVGGDAYGWYYDHAHVRREFGEKKPDIPKNISYIIWK